MQIIDLCLSHLNFYCPATGVPICNEEVGVNDEAESLMGYWSSYTFEEPYIKNETLKRDWEEYSNQYRTLHQGDYPQFEDFENWVKEYDRLSWVVFAITDQGASMGAIFTTWWVIDMDTWPEDEDLTEDEKNIEEWEGQT